VDVESGVIVDVEATSAHRTEETGVVYLVSAWLIMQVLDVMFGALRLPDWSVTLAAALLIVSAELQRYAGRCHRGI
jgi:hypothetical protein